MGADEVASNEERLHDAAHAKARVRAPEVVVEMFVLVDIDLEAKGDGVLAGPVEFNTGELALILLIVLSPSLALGAVCAWLLAKRTPKRQRWPRAILGFMAGFIAGLSIQWFGTRLF